MAAAYKVTVLIERDGIPVPGFPLIRSLFVDEDAPSSFDQVVSVPFVTLPTQVLDNINLLLLRSNRNVILRFDGQSDAGLELNADGFVLLFNTTINASPSTNATISNQSGGTALIDLLAGGT